MRQLPILLLLAALASCNLPSAQAPLLETAAPPVETFMPMCTPPACRANETYFCPGNCPNGCGTVCATVTPEAGLAPLATVQGASEWIVRTQDFLAFLDPSGAKPAFTLQRLYAPMMDYVLVGDGNVYSLTDTGGDTLELNRVYPQTRWFGDLQANRNIEGSLRTAPIFSSDKKSLVWSRAEQDGSPTRSVFVTTLDTGETHQIWQTDLPAEAAGHALVPLFYDEAQGVLVYALHEFYSGMTPTQVASLYLADLNSNKIMTLWPLKPAGMYAGVSASVSPDGGTLAYLTWGEPQADGTLPWTLHMLDLSTRKETKQRLIETWESVEVQAFAPDGKSLVLTASRHASNNGYRSELIVFDSQKKTWKSIYIADETKPFMSLRAWSEGNWLILTSDTDNSTWVMHPDGGNLTQVTPLEWVGMLEP